ncbi:ATPase family associated with various cellular activities (AAA) [Ruminococcaceae bacterium YRB3002]|nr:ATPase family associated with various cellular activities (AAA) [Ruminococcaceae bacterium YRB3002]
MIYYQYFLEWKDIEKKGKVADRGEFAFREPVNAFERRYSEGTINCMNDEYRIDYQKNEDYLIFISKRTEISAELCVAVNVDAVCGEEYEARIRADFPDCRIARRAEITIEEFRREVDAGRYNGGHKIIGMLGLDYRAGLFDPYPFEKDEQIYGAGHMTKAQCKRRAKEILASSSMNEELDRIYSRSNARKYYGHPVHYMISAGEWGAAMDMIELLIGALASNNRLLSGRQTIIRSVRKGTYRDERYRQIINAAEGGIVVLEIKGQDDMGAFATDFHEFTKVTGDILSKQKKDTLFIFVEIMGESFKNADALSNITSRADIIQITEGSGTLQQARDYLMELVSKVEFVTDDKEDAYGFLPEQDSYTVTDIYSAYNAWYGSGLKNHVYKAYRTQSTFKVQVTVAGSKPYDELQKLIGLAEIKAIVDQIIAAGRVKCVRERMGLNVENTSMHMIFTGNPGTAKTTVARLIAQILKDEDVVRSGKFVECGRQDLVAKYVGWTAKVVEEKFRAAQGGVLFIDEAYALVDGSNSYGAEAINTITQLMENYRDQVIVIFAGYPDKMREFLEQNEGLRSRIAFHLNFPDYTALELVEIMKLMCGKREYVVSDEALAECRDIFEQAARVNNFGNGRYVRNVLEQAIMRQSNRVIEGAAGAELTREDMCRLEACDFRFIPLGDKAQSSRFGFAV